MRPCERLVESCRDDWEAVTGHAFLQALAAGRLPRGKMAWYLAQGQACTDAFVRLLAAAAAHAPDLAGSLRAARILAQMEAAGQRLCRSSAGLCGRAAETGPCGTGAALLGLAGQSGCYAQMLAALLAADWSLASWAAAQDAARTGAPDWAAGWIGHYGDPRLGEALRAFCGELDALWPGLDAAAQGAAAEMFRLVQAHGRALLDAAWAIDMAAG
ncbi:hypothetical protein [Poseidonocella sp. HB161398]|uniref:hypothetical protein n=1 Tax=Poseidonocella sp. HB161398 TaxID=2320855 RepID=UPI001109741F|nr:hypothetical protein [Poseidonocella sp. HB161398]